MLRIAGGDRAADEEERCRDVEHQQPLDGASRARAYASRRMDTRERHLRLLTETIEAVNSTLDLEEVLALVATKVADALHADACFVYLYDERADELVLRATHGTRDRGDDPPAADAARRGDHRLGRGGARAGDARVAGAPRPALQELPEPARGRVRVDPRRADPRPRRHARGRAERPHPRAARVLGRRGRAAARDRRAGRAVDRAREALRGGAAPRARARGAGADLGGGLRVALPRGVARGDRQDDDGRARGDRRGARARGRPDRLAGGRRVDRTRSASRCAGAAARSASSSPTASRPFTEPDRELLASIAHARRGRARARAGGAARRARPGDPPPRQEQPADRRVAAAAAGARRRTRSTRARRSSTRSTASSRSRPCTSC